MSSFVNVGDLIEAEIKDIEKDMIKADLELEEQLEKNGGILPSSPVEKKTTPIVEKVELTEEEVKFIEKAFEEKPNSAVLDSLYEMKIEHLQGLIDQILIDKGIFKQNKKGKRSLEEVPKEEKPKYSIAEDPNIKEFLEKHKKCVMSEKDLRFHEIEPFMKGKKYDAQHVKKIGEIVTCNKTKVFGQMIELGRYYEYLFNNKGEKSWSVYLKENKLLRETQSRYYRNLACLYDYKKFMRVYTEDSIKTWSEMAPKIKVYLASNHNEAEFWRN